LRTSEGNFALAGFGGPNTAPKELPDRFTSDGDFILAGLANIEPAGLSNAVDCGGAAQESGTMYVCVVNPRFF
jgi:hypothetical protein